MKQNRALMFIVTLFTLSFLYSCVYFFIPLREMAGICLFNVDTPSGEICALNFSLVFMGLYMFFPLITSIFLQKFIYKEPFRDTGFKFSWSWWYIYALLVPIFISLLTIPVATIFPGVEFVSDGSGLLEKYSEIMSDEQIMEMQRQITAHPPLVTFFIGLGQALIAAVTINAVFALGEEAGWRGFLINSLKDKGFIKATLIIGLAWGIWHFPVVIQGYNYPETPVAGVFLMILWCALYSPLFSYLYFKTGSFVPAAVMHGGINATAGFSVVYLKGGTDIMTSIMGMPGIIVLVCANILLLVYDNFIAKNKIIMQAGASDGPDNVKITEENDERQ